MKLAVISDIHGNLPALEAVLNEIDNEVQPDQVWVLGDLAAHGPHPAECVEVVRERHEADKDHFKVIGGNTDRYLVNNSRMSRLVAKDEETYQQYVSQFQAESAMLDWAREKLGWANYEFLSKIIGREIAHNVPEYGFVMGYHAVPGNDEQIINSDTPNEEALDSVLDRPLRLGIYGHIHRQVDRDLGRVRLVNPGSVGMSFEKPGVAQYAILTFDHSGDLNIDFRNLPFDVVGVIALAKEAGHPHLASVEKALRGEG
jgi:predicted phosphodiesterase